MLLDYFGCFDVVFDYRSFLGFQFHCNVIPDEEMVRFFTFVAIWEDILISTKFAKRWWVMGTRDRGRGLL